MEHDVTIGTIPYHNTLPQSEVNAVQDAATNLPPPPPPASQSVISIQPGRMAPPPPGFIINLPSEGNVALVYSVLSVCKFIV